MGTLSVMLFLLGQFRCRKMKMLLEMLFVRLKISWCSSR
jgi:hypothetical protein